MLSFSPLSVSWDASQDAYGHVMYFHSVNVCEEISITFLMSESKLPPKAATTIPKIELCATVNAIQSTIRNISKMVKKKPYKIKFYSDSKVVIGYINNEERRFACYVGNRVNVIRKLFKPTDWSFIDTSANPTYCATRCQMPHELVSISWLN